MTCLRRSFAAVGLAVLAVSCGGATGPAQIDTRNDRCAHCRMPVSNVRFAAQVTAPGEEPAFFDDVGCLADYLKRRSDLVRGTTAYVADHRTGEWIPAAAALFTRNPSVDTPMNSHIIAHASAESRDADPAARGGDPVPAGELFPSGVPTGR
ncbi:MAG: nitrous oxide reductase accessory protein NosL [Acidobacteriota bacterium]